MKKITIKPSNNVFVELKKTSSDFASSLVELIDNSIGSMVNNHSSITIEVSGNWTEGNQKSLKRDSFAKVIISDDSKGISLDDLGRALSPAAMSGSQTSSLHEHGLGLKLAIRSLGSTEEKTSNGDVSAISGFEILTKTENDKCAHRITKMCFDDVDVEEIDNTSIFPKGHGTVITVSNLDKVYTARKDYARLLVPYLGQRYQRFLEGVHNKHLKLNVLLTDKNGVIIKDSDGRDLKFEVAAQKPEWDKEIAPIVRNFPSGKGSNATLNKWSAKMVFGYNPSVGDIELYPKDDPVREKLKYTNPYYVKSQKIDIFVNDILLCQKDLTWLYSGFEDTTKRYWRKEFPRIQVILNYGFSTSFTKTDVQLSSFLEDLKEEIKRELKPYQTDKYTPRHDSETVLKDKLEEKLHTFCSNVKRETTASIYGYRMDFSLERKGKEEIWEVKKDEGTGPDIGQLIMYLQTSQVKHGVLLANGFNDNARSLCADIPKLFPGYEIELIELGSIL